MNISQEQVGEVMDAVLETGDDVFIHASLGRIGHLDEGVDAFIAAIIDAVGPAGTVIMMADTRSFARTGRFSMGQPSETGLLTERFRLTPGVRRSCVPMVSFCALGARADEYLQPYHSHLDETATILRHLRNDGKLMLLGVGYEKCTLYHLSEERHAVPYNVLKEFSGVLVEDGKAVGPISQRYFVRRDMSIRKDPTIAGRMLEEGGGAQIVGLGKGLVRTFRARDFDDCCMRALQNDPMAFLA